MLEKNKKEIIQKDHNSSHNDKSEEPLKNSKSDGMPIGHNENIGSNEEVW